jgi:MoaA/NifB/PqqE/SkfB family radical SAM enzyme
MRVSKKKVLINFVKKNPTLCIFEVTKKCNSRCNMCSIWENASNNEMTLPEFKKVFHKLNELGICEVMVQGGEPLMHRNIKDILVFLTKHFGVRVVTNGTLLTSDFVDFLKKHSIALTISLDSLSRKRYFAIRGIDSLDAVLKNIELLENKKYFNVLFHCTVSKVNAGEVFKIRDFVTEKGFSFSALPYVSGVGAAGKFNKKLAVKNKVLIKVFEKLRELEEHSDYIFSLFYSDVVDYLKGKYIGPCDALTDSIYLTEEGLIAPCIEKKSFIDAKKRLY